ncbi:MULTISPECIES: serine hydrolase [Thioclava]|nr:MULTISPECIES: serine hydrolase [Thioclava]MAQ37121.1 serine hydrolase [Thioclava sp.]OOY02907.1 serine hydrolase [Thioclava sp. F28-4]OOY19406.1 serine hydrolase [Thioclava sp. DLFJ5-1]
MLLGGALLLASLMAGPLSAAAQTTQPLPELALPKPMPAPPMTVLLPVPDARITAAISTLDDLSQDILKRTGIPGLAVAVVHNGRTVYARGFGKRAVGSPEGVDPETVFLLASLSKPVGATVVATQVTAGRVKWDSPIHDFLAAFSLGDPWINEHITIADLYAHRSGLPDHAGDDLEDIGFDRSEILKRLALLPQGPFRAQYTYTNFGITAAAQAVATAAGKDWARLSETALYAPLGMGATSSTHADYMARDNRAASHVPGGDGYVISDKRQPDAQSPAGGVSSNAHDMGRWMAMVLGGGMADGTRLISEEALLPATSPQMIRGAPMAVSARAGAYGFGFNVDTRWSGRVMLSHSGAFTLGASTSVAMLPELDLGIVVLTNAPPTGAAEAITASFLDRAELGRDTHDWLAAYAPIMAPLSAPVGQLVGAKPPADPAQAAPAQTYVGTYDNPYFGPASISETNGSLVLTLGPDHRALPMRHWDGDTFVVYPVTENQPAGSVSRVTFRAASPGPATEMQIEHLNEEHLGIFRRPD